MQSCSEWGYRCGKRRKQVLDVDAKIPGEDTWAPCACFVLKQELTGFRTLFGSLLHRVERISGYFNEIHKTNLKIRTLDFTGHCTNTELGAGSVLKGLLEKWIKKRLLYPSYIRRWRSSVLLPVIKKEIEEHRFNLRWLKHCSHHLHCQYFSWCLWRLCVHEPSSHHSILTARDS